MPPLSFTLIPFLWGLLAAAWSLTLQWPTFPLGWVMLLGGLGYALTLLTEGKHTFTGLISLYVWSGYGLALLWPGSGTR
ncbi:hypothetical protein DVJ83_15375 (plasmid) [Deinococcus wulumuqiensis]|uniref:Apolipoprotein N-acyltransferase n=1 Tax=Deinococcus wulumuqiensis TaxID=980427 RepID=A0A345ILI4_9DEIO|nr:hypothetical protein [Deinococcus wulumuqiensis]AXH00557.1 hypothetical protein DVJ83_15375 [Deinococcus wulumuqiensis]